MAKLTIVFGILLIGVGSWGFFATGSVHPTALIPTYFGLVLAWSGGLAIAQPKKKMLWMHVAVMAGLLGFLGAGAMAIVELVKAHGGPLAHPAAVESQVAMAGICLVFTVLCVRSFIAARRSRELDAAA
jgi:tetrahydromethanopterin S-methyltransferase subunit C